MALILASGASGDQSTSVTQSIQSLMQEITSKHTFAFASGSFGASSVFAPAMSWQDELDVMEKKIKSIFDVLPKQNGNLQPQAVRYLAHRYLLDNHGLHVKGLQPCSHCVNASVPVWEDVELVKKSLSSTTQQALASWNSRGMGPRDTAAVVLALEKLVFAEGLVSKFFIQRAYKLNGVHWRSEIPAHKFAEVLNTHFAIVLLEGSSWIHTSPRGQKVWHRLTQATNVSFAQHQDDRNRVVRMFRDTWPNLKILTRKAVSSVKKGQQNQQPLRFSFEETLLVLTKVAQEFGSAQNKECAHLRSDLHSKDPSGSGSVPVRSFYVADDKLITETPEYLRSMGVLDESQPQFGPQVMIANYIESPTNCVIQGSQYSVCCIPECESILAHFESQIQGPVASPSQILAAAATLPLRTVHSGVSLEPGSLVNEALQQVAGIHGGVVPLHARLFSEWLHYVFPSECKYPYPSGAIESLSRAEWYLRTGLNPDIDSKAPPVFPDVNASEIPKGKSLSQWTLVEEMYAGSLEKKQETTLPFGIGATGVTFGVIFMLYTTMLCHSFSCSKVVVTPEPYLKV
jgi:hypothetical protein